jgi:ABC-type phosphate transport system substrate-binding protein
MAMRTVILLFTACFWFICSHAAAADLVVVVNPGSGIDTLTKNDVINIFMGRYRTLPSGERAMPVDLALPPEGKAQFYSTLVSKDLSQIDSYWARLKFSGQGPPPQQAFGSEEMINIISNKNGAIGYLEKKNVDKRVKVVLDLTR